MSFSPKAALQQTKKSTAKLESCTSKWRVPADSKLPRLGPAENARSVMVRQIRHFTVLEGGIPASGSLRASCPKAFVFRVWFSHPDADWTKTGQDRNFQRTLRAIGPYLFLGKFIRTNGPQSSVKVSVLTGIGPWMALPNLAQLTNFRAAFLQEISSGGLALSFFSLIISKTPRKTSRTSRIFLAVRTGKKIAVRTDKSPGRKTPRKQKHQP